MCQKAEGESNYLVAVDKATRMRGYNAFKAGEPIANSISEHDHPLEDYSDRHQWKIGWRTAQAGHDPW